MAAAALVGCTDDIVPGEHPSGEGGAGTGEMVFFSSGTTENEISRAASTYYMPDASRFVCRMYYKAQTGSDLFDVSGATDQTSWLKVSGTVGNSLYWNKEYHDVGTNKGEGGVDEYGNDYSAHAFYWQNRKSHAFLAWTDLNRATSMVGGTTSSTLTSKGDFNYRVKTNDKISSWRTMEYDLYDGGHFARLSDMVQYVKDTYLQDPTDAEALATFNTKQDELGSTLDFSGAYIVEESETEHFYFKYPLAITPVDATHRKEGWFKYVITDAEKKPLCTFYYEQYQEKKEEERYDEFPALAFDLTRKPVKDAQGKITSYAINSMAEQPDIAQALTIQAPVGGTQEANRVNLYFKHQFSQVQVNIRNSADNSVELAEADILNVELLGVSEEGYVFTELDENGKVLPAAYKAIDFSKYSEEQLKDNKFGTSFDMFVMPTAETGFLRSFNALTFGQLQAIRITWKESGDDGVRHYPTYRIPTDELINLKSGMRYIWNIEIRRGVLAVIRTEIVDWELPTDAPHNGQTDGTIVN